MSVKQITVWKTKTLSTQTNEWKKEKWQTTTTATTTTNDNKEKKIEVHIEIHSTKWKYLWYLIRTRALCCGVRWVWRILCGCVLFNFSLLFLFTPNEWSYKYTKKKNFNVEKQNRIERGKKNAKIQLQRRFVWGVESYWKAIEIVKINRDFEWFFAGVFVLYFIDSVWISFY